MTEPAKESAVERLERYVRLATEARDLAARSRSFEMRESCLEMAAQWLAMAAAAERGVVQADTAMPSAAAREEQPERSGIALS